MTLARRVLLRSLRFLACGGFSTTTRAFVPNLRSRHSRAFSSHSVASTKETVLVVGDGDLSYSASIAPQTAQTGSSLIASVLEKEQEHQEVYRNSQQHVQTISSFESHQVLFDTDATQLHKSFDQDSFDRIEFNFPHWKGKSNTRYNRQLLGEFLESASQVLKRDGEIQVALRKEQGGSHAQDLRQWRLSWQAVALAADARLLLSRLEPFQPNYDVSSYRGKDKHFHVGDDPERYVFTFPSSTNSVERKLQLCYRHEIRIQLDPDCLEASAHSKEALLNDDIVLELARKVAPEGVHVELPAKMEITPHPGKNTHFPLLVFLLCYGGERVPLTRMDADAIRAELEETTIRELGFPLAKKGRLVSKPFPCTILEQLLKQGGHRQPWPPNR